MADDELSFAGNLFDGSNNVFEPFESYQPEASSGRLPSSSNSALRITGGLAVHGSRFTVRNYRSAGREE